MSFLQVLSSLDGGREGTTTAKGRGGMEAEGANRVTGGEIEGEGEMGGGDDGGGGGGVMMAAKGRGDGRWGKKGGEGGNNGGEGVWWDEGGGGESGDGW